VSIEYHVKGDAAYFRAVRDRFYRQRPVLLRLTSQFSILGACLILPWVYAWATGASWKEGAEFGIPVGIVIAVGSFYLTKALILARLRSRGKSSEGTVTLSEEGVTGRGQHGQSLQYWASYPRAVRFFDGILLLRGGVIRWLPDSALQKGSAEEATALVAAKTQLRRIRI
jgi:hypothetical protein